MTRGRSAALAALPVVALAFGWLAGPQASAQTAAPRPPAAEAGKGKSAPQADLAGRKALYIVGSATLKPVTDLIVTKMVEEYAMPQPIENFQGTAQGFKEFCAGVGAQYPDIVASQRRMEQGEYEDCLANHVLDVIQVEIGHGAVVVVTRKGNPVFNVTPRMFYFALADKIPDGKEFKFNTNKTWKDTKKSAPNLPIRVVLPAKGSGTRAFFEDFFMQTGCRHLEPIDAIFSARERVPLCITMRDDGRITELPQPFEGKVVAALANTPPGTVAIVPRSLYLANRDKLSVLPVDGVLPTHENIDNYDYEMTTTLVFYFKRASMLENDGTGLVRGMPEFMAEITEPAMTAEDGAFEKLGLTALSPGERRHQQSVARRLVRYRP